MELEILMGLQASGKSTFCDRTFSKTHEVISKDRMRNNKNRNRRQTQLIEAALHCDRSVVIDNTNPTIEDRASLIRLGQFYNARIIGYFFESDVHRSLERNQQRTGKAKVPDVGIYATIKKLVLPSYSEGFHQLFYVQIELGNVFKVTEWNEMRNGKQ